MAATATKPTLGTQAMRLHKLMALVPLTDELVADTNAGRLDPVDAVRAKLYTSEVNGRMVDEGLQLHGGAGYMEEYPICRLYQDERVHRILAGTSEIMKEIIARSMLDD